MSIQTEAAPLVKRVDYIDMTKCIGMLAIIWGHIMISGWSYYLVYSFHIPLFFFLSGMMFNGSKYPTVFHFIKRRTKTLLLPYLMFSLVTWAFWVGMNVVTHAHVNYWKPLLQTFIAQGSGGFMVHNVPLWFVTCLFVVEMLYYFLDNFPKGVNLLICVLCAILGDYMIRGGHLSAFRLLPWNLEGAMSALLFYSAGNLLMKKTTHRDIVEAIRNRQSAVLSMIVILTALLVFSSSWNGHITLGSNSLGRNTIVFYCNAFIGIFTTISFSVLLSIYTEKGLCRIGDRLKWFGRNSFYVMATHVPVKGMVILVVASIFQLTPSLVSGSIKWSLVAFGLTIVLDSVVVYLVTKLKKHDEMMMRSRRGLGKAS